MPTVIRMPASRQNSQGGFNICCCRVFTCVNLDFITSKDGLLKLFEVLLGSFCQSLLVKFGLPAAQDIGQAFNSFLTTASACLLTSSILLFCYIVSARTFHLVRQSLFEVAFNVVACFMYWSASSYMAFAVTMWLSPRFSLQPGYIAYPAMTAVYYIGIMLGIIHGLDGYIAYKHFRGFK